MADYGSDTDAVSDLPRKRTLATGPRVLQNRIARSLMTPQGALAAIGGDPQWGEDVRLLVNATMTGPLRDLWRARIAACCERDPEVQSADVVLDFTAPSSTLTIPITLTPADGSAPFELVLSVTALTVAILER